MCVHRRRRFFFTQEAIMQRPRSDDERPGTKMRDPAEGKRADTPPAEASADIAEQPGTKTIPPAEGGDDVSGAERAAGSRQRAAGSKQQ
jgi:hypothetical protein